MESKVLTIIFKEKANNSNLQFHEGMLFVFNRSAS